MTLPELKALAERVTFRDWEPHFEQRGEKEFFFLWTGKGFATEERFIPGHWGEQFVVLLMKDAALSGVTEQARRDFRVEPAEVTV